MARPKGYASDTEVQGDNLCSTNWHLIPSYCRGFDFFDLPQIFYVSPKVDDVSLSQGASRLDHCTVTPEVLSLWNAKLTSTQVRTALKVE
ncbi:hypothetical protein VNO78_23703 [Psophocarpus tetragonolobus]|uniref:Uncharacterized protein n=1 Tax=Psophocarpus tetragonolobus TaxID=3891 RepID=A0AAN9XE91_PSOTE